LFEMSEIRENSKPRRVCSAVTAVILSLVSAAAGAQQLAVPNATSLEAETVEIRRYSVELIVFQYVGGAAQSDEFFAPEVTEIPAETSLGDDFPGDLDDPLYGEPVALDAGPMESESGNPALEMPLEELEESMEELEEIVTYEQSGLVVLQPDQFSLNDVYRKLEALDAYQPLLHTAWIQPTKEKDVSIPLTLRRLGNPPLRLNGTITLYLSRFLHLVVDLALEEKGAQRMTGTQERVRSYGDEQARSEYGFDFDPRFAPPSIIYRIQEDRIVRNGELRYFDHPKFGVIAKIARIEEETSPENPDTTNDLLPGAIDQSQ